MAQLHNSTSRFVIFVIGLHVALNWDWIVRVLRTRVEARRAERKLAA